MQVLSFLGAVVDSIYKVGLLQFLQACFKEYEHVILFLL